MFIHRNLDHLPAFRRAVITIGTFDGVHTGHQQILDQLRQEAARINGETVIITFDPHPRKIVKGASGEIRLLNTLEEKIGLLAWKGIDHLVIIPFTEAFSQLSAGQYVQEFLVGRFHPHTIIIGYDHRFGKGRQGDYRLLENFSPLLGFELQEITAHLSNAISVSSTRIREAIGKSDIAVANELLGYDFFFSGRVVEGNKLGRTIGYPTANLQVEDPEKLIPGDGVYAVTLWIEPVMADPQKTADLPAELAVHSDSVAGIHSGLRLRGMMNIGMRPTVDGTKRVIEVNIFDFDGDIYGRVLRVFLRKHLRGEQKFNGLDALKEQLAKDKTAAKASLS